MIHSLRFGAQPPATTHAALPLPAPQEDNPVFDIERLETWPSAIGDAFYRTGNNEQLLVDTFKKEFDKANNPDPVSNRKLMKQLLPLAKKKVIRDENGIPIVNYAIAAQHKRPSLFQLCQDAGVIMAPPEVTSKNGKKTRIDVAGQDEGGQTALHKAVRQTKPKPRLVKMLMQTPGVNVNALDFSDTTPVSAAALRGHDEIVKLLLQNPATDPYLGDDVGQTARNYADQALKRAQKAIEDGDRPDLHRAKAREAQKTIDLLESRGAIDFYA